MTQQQRDKRKPKIPKKITESYLHNSGLYYLERYAASSGHFRSVMLRKVRKSCMHHTEQSFDDCALLVDKLIDKFKSSGLLDDDVYVRSMVNSLRRRGLSRRAVIAKLYAKSVSADETNKYLNAYDEEHKSQDTELVAALTLCRKKKIGAFAKDVQDHEDKQKDLAKLARAGFAYDIANKAMDMNLEDAQEILNLPLYG